MVDFPIDISTIASPKPNDVGFNAPNFELSVAGANVPDGIRQLVQRVEYESSDGMADLLRIIFRDPKIIKPKGLTPPGPLSGIGPGGGGSGTDLALRDTRVFQPGNLITVRMGYGSDLKHIGGAIIRKVRPNYPRDDIPTVEVIAYSKDSLMMDNAPEGSKKKKGKGGRVFKDATFADAVRDRARDYGFDGAFLDVDDTPDSAHNFIQKVGLSDYDFVRGLSNITGFFFWVDCDEDGKWTLHFKNPDTLKRDVLQDKVYTFNYDRLNTGSLLDFEPELAIQGATTKLQVKVKDPKTGRMLEATFEEENDESPDVVVSAGTLRAVDEVLEGEYTTASDVKIFIDDFSFEARANRRFKTEAELIAWARQWFRRNRENFVLSSGTIIGVETVFARQIHNLNGLGMGLDGEYFFSNVSHVMDKDSGYELECNFRKVVPGLA